MFVADIIRCLCWVLEIALVCAFYQNKANRRERGSEERRGKQREEERSGEEGEKISILRQRELFFATRCHAHASPHA